MPKFSEEARAVFESLLADARKDFLVYIDSEGRRDTYHIGYRFISDETVLCRIQSATSEETFLEDPRAWVLDALRDCASADHWYVFEKKWD